MTEIYFRLSPLQTRIEPLRNAMNAKGLLYYTWVIPGAVFTIGVGLYFIPLLRHLPRKTSLGIISAGIIYVSGTIVIEMISGLVALGCVTVANEETTAYVLVVTVEEFLEMAGIVLFIFVLTKHLKSMVGEVEINIAPQEATVTEHKPVSDTASEHFFAR